MCSHNKSSKPAPTTSYSPVIWRFALPNTQMYIHMLPIEQIHYFVTQLIYIGIVRGFVYNTTYWL